MCLLAFAYKKHPIYSLILIANRDEYLARPSHAMHRWPSSQVLAGKDLEAGGTWFGINQQGKLAVVTNYREGTKVQIAQGSRGALTRNFLAEPATMSRYLEKLSLTANDYRDFNLLVGDNSGIGYLSNRMNDIKPDYLPPGVYGLSNHLLDTPWRKVSQIKAALAALLTLEKTTEDSSKCSPKESLSPSQLWPILADTRLNTHDEWLPSTGVAHNIEQQLSAVFVRMPGYGTRTSTLLLQKYSGETDVLERTYQLPSDLQQGFTDPDKFDEQSFALELPVFGGSV